MPILNIYHYESIVDSNGRKHEFGSLSTAKQITCSGHVEDKTFQIGTETTVKVWDVDESPLGEFEHLAIEVDRNAILELVTDDDADNGEEAYTVGLLGTGTAGLPGPPFTLSRDDSYAGYTVNFGGGTLDVIETIRIRNLDASNAAEARVFIVT